MLPRFLSLALFLFISFTARAAEPFEIRNGDRVLFLGDTLLEREGTYGYLETRMHEQFPDRHFTVRNLAFSADTPRGWSRASFDPVEKGFERLKEQIALVKPTVVFLGYGMAASLQEMTDRAGDPSLNPDPARYGAEPMSAARFKKELGELMDAIEKESADSADSRRLDNTTPAPSGNLRPSAKSADKSSAVRFVLLSPIRHEDLRAIKPGLPDPAEHNQLLEQYTKAIEGLAQARGARFVDLFHLMQGSPAIAPKTPDEARSYAKACADLVPNGIHLSQIGYSTLAEDLFAPLGWKRDIPQGKDGQAKWRADFVAFNAAVRPAVIRKNELFFHQWRPANETYLFGFRKHEQGQNAKEMPMFDPLIAQAEAEIDRLKGAPPAATVSPAPSVPDAAIPAAPGDPLKTGPTLPRPDFTVEDGYQIELWAENPLLYKPTQMNWDAQGRLWVVSSALYPQITPGGQATDNVLLLEDTNGDGKAEKSTVFAGGLLIPTGVVPVLVGNQDAKNRYGCYVGQSTELLYFEDTKGNGAADAKRIVLSGFGTEDTHHIIHTLKWGPDGRLYFNQSVYIHTHTETPWGVVRLNAGGVLAYDPRTERVEVFDKGLWNSWGHQFDEFGQSFQTDGAGSTGLTWSFPGATFAPSEGARRTLQSISPGAYPKFAGLEIVRSPHFPADWQGNAVTCDFRAHRVVRFAISDLTKGDKPQAGYTTQEMPDLVRTSDVTFRPIDVKMGPDGAIYIADWSNPVINHGEVDFRDPRRDHTNGRIWRVTRKGAAPVKWESLMGKTNTELQARLNSANLWEKEQARTLLGGDPQQVSAVRRAAGGELPALLTNANPRTRLEAMRALARVQTAGSAALVLDAAVKIQDDPFLDYAAWLTINDLAKPWTEAIAKGEWKIAGREKQLEYGLNAIEPTLAGATLAKLLTDGQITLTQGPWIELIGRAGGPAELAALYESLIISFAGDCCPGRTMTAKRATAISEEQGVRIVAALVEAARVRNARPSGELSIAGLVPHAPNALVPGLLQLAGLWKTDDAMKVLPLHANGADSPKRVAAIEGLRALGNAEAISTLEVLCVPGQPFGIRRTALTALASIKFGAAMPFIPDTLRDAPAENEALATWRGLLAVQGGAGTLAKKVSEGSWAKDLPKVNLSAGVKAAREGGRKTQALLAALTPIAGLTAAPSAPADYQDIAARTKQNGDPAQGEIIYRRAASGCVTCHAIGGAGGIVGPSLTSIGASAPLDYIVESMLAPNAKVKEGYNAVTLKLKDGTEVTGIQARETAQEVILRNIAGQETPVPKASITGRTDVGSIMPMGLLEVLSDRERLNLYAFLGELGKPGPYDASRGNVARVWRMYSGAQEPQALKHETKDFPPLLYTNVDGRVPQAAVVEALPMIGDVGQHFYVSVQFQAATAGKVRFNFAGISTAWLDGQPLAIASEPNPSPELTPGTHTLTVKLDRAALPAILRAEAAGVNFLGN